MSEQLTVVTNQIGVFAVLMTVGLMAAKANILTEDALKILSGIIVKIILPALIFSIVAGSGITAKDFLIGGRFALAALLCFLLLSVVGATMSKLCGLEGKTANVFVALAVFGNMGFMGIPLIQALFTEPVAHVCISVYTLVDMALLWTFGVYLCSRHQQSLHPLSAVRNMLNPTTAALLLGLIIMIFNIPVPQVLLHTAAGMGGTSKYLTLMYLGGALAYVSVDQLRKKPSIIMLTLVKMLLMPLLAYFLLGFFLPQTPRIILTLIVGLPSMTTVAMLASTHQSDEVYATEMIFVTTLASLVTIPALSILMSII